MATARTQGYRPGLVDLASGHAHFHRTPRLTLESFRNLDRVVGEDDRSRQDRPRRADLPPDDARGLHDHVVQRKPLQSGALERRHAEGQH